LEQEVGSLALLLVIGYELSDKIIKVIVNFETELKSKGIVKGAWPAADNSVNRLIRNKFDPAYRFPVSNPL
jgi:hypothetical protein